MHRYNSGSAPLSPDIAHVRVSLTKTLDSNMNTIYVRTPLQSIMEECRSHLTCRVAVFLLILFGQISMASAQSVLFDFDNAPLGSNLPIDQTAGGITAHLSDTGLAYSIQEANVLGFTPQGFAGRIIYPNSINIADLFIRFDQPLTDFSIMYACDELGCHDVAAMRVTAFRNGSFVGTNTKRTSHPGTWPVDTLICSFPQGFDSVVIHYDSIPPTCKDYGTIFMADNMRVTPSNPTGISNQQTELPTAYALKHAFPNPFNPATIIRYALPSESHVSLTICNLLGQIVTTLTDKIETAGYKQVEWDASNFPSGIYFYRLDAVSVADPSKSFTSVKKCVLVK